MTSHSREPIRILLLAANPYDTVGLRLGEEMREIEAVLEGAAVRSKVRHVPAARPRDIQRVLRKFRPTFVHFSGHGEKDRGIFLEDANGFSSLVPKEALVSLFRVFEGVKCVLFNSCHSITQAELVAEHVPFVIGMEEAISDRAAIEFSIAFYQAISDGESVPKAFECGQLGIGLAGINGEAKTPVLFGAESGDSERKGEPTTLFETGSLSTRIQEQKFEEIKSVNELADLTWKAFESFALRVATSILGETSLRLADAAYSVADDKDGEARYVFSVGAKDGAQKFKACIELKKRRQRDINKRDIAAHLIDASKLEIDKLIFVTNGGYSHTLASWLVGFSARTGLQHILIDGVTLLEHAQVLRSHEQPSQPSSDAPIPNPPAQVTSAPDISISSWFTLSPHDNRPVNLRQASVAVRPDRPVFFVTEAKCSDQMQPSPIRFVVKAAEDQELSIYPWPSLQSTTQLATPKDEIRQAFVIWPSNSYCGALSSIFVDVISDRPIRVEQALQNTAKIISPVLGNKPLRCQSTICKTIGQRIANWRVEGDFFSVLLVAPPGVGKSHVIATIRKQCHEAGIQDLFLDCETVKSDLDFLRSLFKAYLPFPPTLLDQDLLEPISHWCVSMGINEVLASRIAQDLCAESQSLGKATIDTGLRLSLATAVLTWASRTQALALIVEDLHKAAPSLLAFLSVLIAQLKVDGSSDILIITSTRPFYSGAPTLRADWLSALSNIEQSESNMVFDLTAPSRSEARGLLLSSIIGLESFHADVILDAVGTTPYALREAILFLLARECCMYSDFGKDRALIIADPSQLRLALMPAELVQATEQRLRILFENHPDWLRLLLLGGAVYGRQFPLPIIIESLNLESGLALDEAIDVCSDWNILASSSRSNDWMEFDHDLVRESILLLAAGRTKHMVAKALLAAVGVSSPAQLRCRLAYQANMPESCIDAARQARDEAHAEGRVADVIELNQIAIQTLDPEVAAGILSELIKTGEQNLIDPALRNADISMSTSMSLTERLEAVLSLLLENISCLSTVGSGSSGATEVAITEAHLLAEKLNNTKVEAQLMDFEGRMWFERNCLPKAIELHEQAEALFSRVGSSRDSMRAANLIRQAICLRKSGKFVDSIAVLSRAARQCSRGDWVTLNKVRNNLGAAYLYTDWSKVRYHWERQIKQATRRGLVSRRIHGLASLGFIDLFEGRLEEGFLKASEALDLAEQRRLDNQIIRICLNKSIYCAIGKAVAEGKAYLLKAEQLALRHGVGRRLWRVAANLATFEELLGDKKRAFARDAQVLQHLAEGFQSLRPEEREMLPLVNIVLRAQQDKQFEALFEQIPKNWLVYAQDYSTLVMDGQREKIPGLLGNYCVQLEVGPRFLLSE